MKIQFSSFGEGGISNLLSLLPGPIWPDTLPLTAEIDLFEN